MPHLVGRENKLEGELARTGQQKIEELILSSTRMYSNCIH